MRKRYNERLDYVKQYLSKKELARIKKLPRDSANRRLRRVIQVIGSHAEHSRFIPKNDLTRAQFSHLEKALSPIKGLNGVFLRLNNRNIKSVRKYKAENGREYVEIKGPGIKLETAARFTSKPNEKDFKYLSRLKKGERLIAMKNGRRLRKVSVDNQGKLSLTILNAEGEKLIADADYSVRLSKYLRGVTIARELIK